jgi:uncharacterized protein (UPF0276 family)
LALNTLSLNLDRNLLQTALPLLQSGSVDALEWSFDALGSLAELPDWFAELLTAYSSAGRLLGHGIFYSVCNAGWSDEQAAWLERLRRWNERFPLDHVTEHFGFMTGRDFHRGAPISPPLSAATLAVGKDRLLRLQAACQRPVGLENLALAYQADDVRRQGDFLARLLAPVNGFLLLDAHNLYCQAHNFAIDPIELCKSYPLHLVREIHLSGGSWEAHPSAPGGAVRRDTHDDRVPEAVFNIVEHLMANCPNVKYITLEQLSPALATDEQRAGYEADFQRIRTMNRMVIVDQDSPAPFTPPSSILLAEPYVDHSLFRQQKTLNRLLEGSLSNNGLRTALAESELAATAWRTETWEDHMLETVRLIARKWA